MRKKRNKVYFVDIHSHLLPALDDGPEDIEESIHIIKEAYRDGTRALCLTPHQREGLYENSPQKIKKSFKKLIHRVRQENIPIKLYLGADIHIRWNILEELEQGNLLTIAEGSYFLLELPSIGILSQLKDLLFNLKLQGYTPILTHPEREQAMSRYMKDIENWVESGGLVQITAISITGEYGELIRKNSILLLKKGLVHVVSSDAHTMTIRPPYLSKAYNMIRSLLGNDNAQRLFYHNPLMVLNGQETEPIEDYIPPKRIFWLFRRKNHVG